ncbi:MAG: hypothetical protein IJY23_08085 [Clostridia bacterium]|nr:hypothetical protein [Clostridia bacterium]
MYITVDSYEEMYLKDRTEEEISLEVEKLRREIEKMKRRLESPSYVYDSHVFPSEADTVEIYRSYLERATDKLSLMCGKSVLTEEEKALSIFDSMIDSISCLTLTVGRYLQDKYEIEICGEEARLIKQSLGGEKSVSLIDKKATLDRIRAIRIGEWRDSYLPEHYGCTLNEPTRWQLRIDYMSGAAPKFYDGLGVFPYNFERFSKIFEADIID